MDLLGVPHDLFQLYIPSSIVTGKFDSMVTVMSLLALALLTASAVAGHLRRRLRRACWCCGRWSRLAADGGRRDTAPARSTIDTVYRKDEALKNMHLPRGTLPVALLAEAPSAEAVSTPALQRIRARGVLRVGLRRRPGAVRLRQRARRSRWHGCRAGPAARAGPGRDSVAFVPADSPAGPAAGRRPHRRGDGPALPARTLTQVAYSPPYLDARWAWWCATNGTTLPPSIRIRTLAGDHRDPGGRTLAARRAYASNCPGGPAFRRAGVAEGLLRRQGAAASTPSPCWPRPVRPGRSCTRPTRWWCRSRGDRGAGRRRHAPG